MPGDPLNNLGDLLAACGLTGELALPPAVTLGGLDALIEAEGRPKALSFLKDQGVDKLGQRQKLVNELSKAKREGRLTDEALKATVDVRNLSQLLMC